MKVLQRHLAVLFLVLAFVPVSLSLHIARLSRMIYDDYVHIHIGRELGAWESIFYWRNNWNGSYSDYFSFGLLAPLDTALPATIALFTIVLWLAGATVTAVQILRRLQIQRPRMAALALAALLVSATVLALNPEAFYWLASNTRYALPSALQTCYFAIVLHTVSRVRSRHYIVAVSSAGAAICFVSAGFSEMFMLFQLISLTLAIFCTFVFLDRSLRDRFGVLLGFGWVATIASLIIILTAPGTQIRLETIPNLSYTYPIRWPPDLVSRSLDLTIGFIGDPAAFRGFMMLFCVSLLLALVLYRPKQNVSMPLSFCLDTPPLFFALVSQLLLVPILSVHRSDYVQVFGRFSYAYFSVIGLNVAFIIVIAGLLWQQHRVNLVLRRQIDGAVCFGAVILLVILMLFVMTQVRSIHYRAGFYLHFSSVTLLLVAAWCLKLAGGMTLMRFAALFYAMMVALMFAIVIPSLYLQGYVVERAVTPVIFMQICAGAIWGLTIGITLRRYSAHGMNWLRYASFIVALIIGIKLVTSQVLLLPNFSEFAREWDVRHQLVLDAKAEGREDVEVPRLQFRLARRKVWKQTESGGKDAVYYEADQFNCHRETCHLVFAASD